MDDASRKYGQKTGRKASKIEIEFQNSVAIPILDKTKNEQSLMDISLSFWNLCLWEQSRADILDTKASYLLGLSGIVAAVVAVGGINTQDTERILNLKLIIIGGISLLFFIITVFASLYTLLGKKYGTFSDKEVFSSLLAYKNPVGGINEFEDKEPRRCFLKETILQRWLIYRWYSEANDIKFLRLRGAQFFGFLSILSLFVFLIMLFIKW